MSTTDSPDDAPRPGRPTRLTDSLIEACALAIAGGCFLPTAGRALRVSDRTMRRWLALGRQRPTSIYGTFRRRIAQAEAEFECNAVAAIARAGHEEDPKHLEWLLERKYPQRWGQFRGELGILKRRIAELERAMGIDPEPPES